MFSGPICALINPEGKLEWLQLVKLSALWHTQLDSSVRVSCRLLVGSSLLKRSL